MKMSGRMKTLDDSKNEFVSNVSPELKITFDIP